MERIGKRLVNRGRGLVEHIGCRILKSTPDSRIEIVRKIGAVQIGFSGGSLAVNELCFQLTGQEMFFVIVIVCFACFLSLAEAGEQKYAQQHDYNIQVSHFHHLLL